jgi:hypothetical protein
LRSGSGASAILSSQVLVCAVSVLPITRNEKHEFWVASNDVTLMSDLMKTRDVAPELKHADTLTQDMISLVCLSLCPAFKKGIEVYIVQHIHTAAAKIGICHTVGSDTYLTRIISFNRVDLHIEKILVPQIMLHFISDYLILNSEWLMQLNTGFES